MSAIKQARQRIQRHPRERNAMTVARLVLALESHAKFPLADLYLLDKDWFKLALRLLRQWRQDGRYAGKLRLFDLSMQIAAPQ